MEKTRLRHAVIGCGSVAQNAHLPAIGRCARLELTALADALPGLAEGVARSLGLDPINSVGDADAVLTRPDIDSVSICALTPEHAPLAIQALEQGKHVLVEKPMAVSSDEARRMTAAAQAAGKTLMIGYNHSYDLAAEYVRGLLDSGELGELLHVEAFFYEDRDAWHAGAFRNPVTGDGPPIPWPRR